MTTPSLQFGSLVKSLKRAERLYESRQATYKRQIAELRAKAAKIEDEARAIENTSKAYRWPHAIQKIVKPIGESVLALMPAGWTMEVLGPFGLCCEVSIHFYRLGVGSREQLDDGNCRSLSFVSDPDRGIAIRDYATIVRECPPNSIGALNGMHYGTLDIPDDADASWFIAYMEKSEMQTV